MTPAKLRSMLRTAWRDLQRTSEARRNLPPGSSRARVTTANARWQSASEEWARCVDLAHEHGHPELVDEVQGS